MSKVLEPLAFSRFLEKLQTNNEYFTKLVLKHKTITEQQLKALFKGMRKHEFLHFLDVSHHVLCGDDSKILNLSKMLLHNISITTLIISNNYILPDRIFSIAEALSSNTTLEVLELNNNCIQQEGAFAIANALLANPRTSLKSLSMSSNAIGDIGTDAIAKMLITNDTIEILNLNNNQIGDAGAEAIANMLSINTTLQKLYIDYNSIETIGIFSIAYSLIKNNTLSFLYCENNANSYECWKWVILLLQDTKNTTIRDLAINHQDMVPDDEYYEQYAISAYLKYLLKTNNIIYNNQFWNQQLHLSFSTAIQKIVLAVLLCNRYKRMFHDDYLWFYIFSFFQRIRTLL